MQLWIHPLLFFAGGLLTGYLINKIILAKIRKLSGKTAWKGDDILTDAVTGFPLLWCFLAGMYGSVLTAPISPAQTNVAHQILLVLLILSVTVFLARIATGISVHYRRRHTGQFPSATILTNLTRIFIYVLGLLTIFYSFGINITPALTALGIGGLAVALALQDTLSNLFAGLQIIASRQITTGHFIRLTSGEEGFVTDITWRNTTLRTTSNNMVIIPNSKLASDIFTNYSLPENQMAVVARVGVSYDSDLTKVEQITMEVAREVMKEVAGGVPEFEPTVRYHTFADFSINFAVTLRSKDFTDQQLIKHELIKRLHQRYAQEGVEIPYPVRTVFLNEKPKM